MEENISGSYFTIKSLCFCFGLILMFFFLSGGEESQLEFDFDPSLSVLTIRKPGMNAGEDWSITLK